MLNPAIETFPGVPRTRKAWAEALAKLPYVPVAYSNAEIDYQHAYMGGQDISLILDNGVWPLTMKDGKVSSGGRPVLPPLTNLGRWAEGRLVSKCLEYVKSLGASVSSELFSGRQGLSPWHDHAAKAGARASVGSDLYFDLTQDPSAFRKGHRAAVTAGLRIWETSMDVDASVWGEFAALHMKAAGRLTRSLESWALQYRAIQDGDAFLVYLRDATGAMVGGGYFTLTRDEGCYSVAAYDRSLFSKPLGHVVQFRAIEEMKRRGLKWYRIGERFYEGTDKEVSISEFKSGFATHIFPQYTFQF